MVQPGWSPRCARWSGSWPAYPRRGRSGPSSGLKTTRWKSCWQPKVNGVMLLDQWVFSVHCPTSSKHRVYLPQAIEQPGWSYKITNTTLYKLHLRSLTMFFTKISRYYYINTLVWVLFQFANPRDPSSIMISLLIEKLGVTSLLLKPLLKSRFSSCMKREATLFYNIAQTITLIA